MKYKGKSIEVIGSKILFGKETLWIHILEDDSFAQVLRSDLEEDMPENKHAGMSYVRYIAIAARIKEEIAQKRLLAPYESSLIPLPHQILVLEKAMQGVQTRFMLADEVGMGKTIEASLILKEKKLRGEIKRLLLSATPHRGKSDHFRRVLQLMDADAFSGEGMPSIEEISPYVMRSEKRYAVDYIGKKLFQKRETIRLDVPLDNTAHHLQKQLYEHVTDYVRYCFGRAKRGSRNATGLVMVMMQKLASSSTAAILAAMQTRLWRLQHEEIADNINDYDEEGALDFEDLLMDDYSVNLQGDSFANEEEKLQELITEARYCLENEQDAKATALIRKIIQLREEKRNSQLKVLVFTEFRKTQEYLTKQIEQAGLTTVCINGSMDLQERQRALVKFKNEANVMIATNAAGESLNMQFCHIVFNYDLPWNPMAIEQRIGRVDRIGQKHPVTALNMLTDNTVDTRVYQIIVEKLDAILQELGIDKTSDVLGSTIDMKRVNHLYLQSLLDPKRFDFASDSWLYEIKSKRNEYKSTEGALPVFNEEDINKESAGEIKFSPLPVWLEELMDLYVLSENGKIDKRKIRRLQVEKEEWNNTFAKGRSVVPDVKLILTVRVDG